MSSCHCMTGCDPGPHAGDPVTQARQRLLRDPGPGARGGEAAGGRGHRDPQAQHRQPGRVRFRGPPEILEDILRNLSSAQATATRRACCPRAGRSSSTTRPRASRTSTSSDVYLGNGVSELIVMAMQALLDDGDEVLVPAPDYPLWTAAVCLAGGTPCTTAATSRPTGCPTSPTSSEDHRPHQGDRHHQPEQPDGRGLPRRDARAASSRSPAGTTCSSARRRDLRQDPLRRRRAHLDRRRSPPTCSA